ncbi:hypothetical protein MPF_1622 [Methanohalophilus portucalensis FDF-1]|uniref:Uncharacterized protein n=1 Tax=Methanohalophilus portucalensis FDF-1 TaxID=523843 RepID=A0A1L9C3J8_9EURY|nr:hypothetical protein MPF_1622 [Methanohalophilus portucalensis FDF-1]
MQIHCKEQVTGFQVSRQVFFRLFHKFRQICRQFMDFCKEP